MVAPAARQRPNLTLAPLAALAGLAAMLGAWAVPAAMLGAFATESRIAAPAMHLGLALLAGLAVGCVAWLGLRSAAQPSRVVRVVRVARAAGSEDRVPALRRADAHPDAPARLPLRAMLDLGTPFLEVRALHLPPAECAVPFDLDQPLSAYDPGAILDSPLPASELVAPLHRKEAVRTLPVEPAEPPMAAPATDAAVHAMLDRLERDLLRRRALPAPKPERGLEQALADLRRLAARY